MSTLDILVRARALYAASPSHAPVGSFPAPGTRCVVAALGDAGAREITVYKNVSGALLGVLDSSLDPSPDPSLTLAYWNAKHTTEEVLAAFDRAIETERERCLTRNGSDRIPVREPVRTLNEPVPA